MHPDDSCDLVRPMHQPPPLTTEIIHRSDRRTPTMKKLRLDCDALRVESFPTDHAADEHTGTVRAYGATPTCTTATLVGGSCPQATCKTYDDTFCGLTHGCE
jgi:hypothetical protein